MGIPNVKMFPAALRRGFDSVFTSEDNITGIIRAVTDKDSYIIKLDNTTPVKFVIHGYYFELTNRSIADFTGDRWAAIKLDSSNRLVRYSNGSTVLDENGVFEGLEIVNSQPTNSDNSHKIYSLQLTSGGVAVASNFSKLSPESIQVESNVNSGSNKPVSSGAVYTAINSAINDLDVGQVPATVSDSNYIKAISESNGKISATLGTVSDTYSATSSLPISGKGVAVAIQNLDSEIAAESNKAISAITITDGKINSSSKITIPTNLGQLTDTIHNVTTGTEDIGTSGCLAKFSGTKTITNGPQLGSATTTFLRNDGSWAVPYTLPTASADALGGIKVGFTTSASNRNYAVQLSSGNAYVNVPWTDTTYTLPTASSSALGGIKIGYSESGKNYAVQLSSGKAYVNVPWTDTTYSAGTGISISSGSIINTGVRSVTINSSYLRVNTNGTNNDLTIPYSTSANSATNDSDGNKISTTYLKVTGGSSGYNSWGFKRIVAQSSAPSSPSSGDIWIKI